MSDYIGKGLCSPPRSPSREGTLDQTPPRNKKFKPPLPDFSSGLQQISSSSRAQKGKRKTPSESTVDPETPPLINNVHKKSRSGSPSGSKRIKNSNDMCIERDSRSVSMEMETMVANLKNAVKMLGSVKVMKELTSDQMLACFMSAQTVIVACTAQLISRTARPHAPASD